MTGKTEPVLLTFNTNLDRSVVLCPACLSEYKRSPEGRRARKMKKDGDDAAWGKGEWPYEIYHRGAGRVCPRHALQTGRKVRSKYEERLTLLLKLGYATYKSYLKSDVWSEIRERCFTAFGTTCHFCDAAATQVHHSAYTIETLRGDSLVHLYPVCQKCHSLGEFEASGEKCSPKVATLRMRRHGCENGCGKQIRHRERERKLVLSQLNDFPSNRLDAKY